MNGPPEVTLVPCVSCSRWLLRRVRWRGRSCCGEGKCWWRVLTLFSEAKTHTSAAKRAAENKKRQMTIVHLQPQNPLEMRCMRECVCSTHTAWCPHCPCPKLCVFARVSLQTAAWTSTGSARRWCPTTANPTWDTSARSTAATWPRWSTPTTRRGPWWWTCAYGRSSREVRLKLCVVVVFCVFRSRWAEFSKTQQWWEKSLRQCRSNLADST